MPHDIFVDFVAVDEIQMCIDHERGHIFTDRLLNSRGEKLTMFLGSHYNEIHNKLHLMIKWSLLVENDTQN